MNMKYIKIIFLFVGIACTTACSDYLDLVPEGTATLDNAFSNRNNAERYLLTCFSRLPDPTNMFDYPALMGSDEFWFDYDVAAQRVMPGAQIAQGYQNTNEPWQNYWDGAAGGTNVFVGIRDCNIFLENIVDRPYDVRDPERNLWIAEAKFLKAYLHFFLLKLYGPIPIIKENLPISSGPDEVRLYREPVDDVVEYIVQLLEEALPDLPLEIGVPLQSAGRITQPIALAVKAQVLVWAASPLLNGSAESAPVLTLVDNRGKELFPREYQVEKWQRAATAIKTAIDVAHQAHHALYTYLTGPSSYLSDTTLLQYTLRGAVTEPFNEEIVWPDTHSTVELQRWIMPFLAMANYGATTNEVGATLKIAEQFYTNNGLPIDEDPSWDYNNRYQTQKDVAGDHGYYINLGVGLEEVTAKLHFYREPRFYSSVGFDRGIYESIIGATTALKMRAGEASGVRSENQHNVTGYVVKKLLHQYTYNNVRNYIGYRYSYPMIRLPDLYLLYAEALNETGGNVPSSEVYAWVDRVRTRAGIPKVKESYAMANVEVRDKPNSKAGMRQIIKRERLIELAFEGHRFWDLRRWRDAASYMNEPVRGWSYREGSAAYFYTVTNIWYQRVFTPRDYLWPLKLNSVIVNSNLKQNPGWEN
jgi:hypothetical protein